MIDAYEIGIQLALQDDVSAGLEVINRGLAEVDRAIDATSAKLVDLASAAQAVTGSATTGIAKRPDAASGQNVQGSVAEPLTESVTPPSTGSSLDAPLPSRDRAQHQSTGTSPDLQRAAASSTRAEQSKPAVDRAEAIAAAPTVGPEREQASAPTVVQVQHLVEPVTAPSLTQPFAEPETPSRPAVAKPASRAQTPSVSVSSSVAPEKSDGPATATPEKIFTASVAQVAPPAKAYRSAEGISSPLVHRSGSSVERAGRAIAPWSGVDTRALSPRPETVSNGPAAPQARQQDRSESLTGTVMLDGHQVGYWLAEQMAKEASRPPSGTSFFDPRQTPAWTASGSL